MNSICWEGQIGNWEEGITVSNIICSVSSVIVSNLCLRVSPLSFLCVRDLSVVSQGNCEDSSPNILCYYFHSVPQWNNQMLTVTLYFYISQETYFVSNCTSAQYASELKKEKSKCSSHSKYEETNSNTEWNVPKSLYFPWIFLTWLLIFEALIQRISGKQSVMLDYLLPITGILLRTIFEWRNSQTGRDCPSLYPINSSQFVQCVALLLKSTKVIEKI